MHYQPRDRAPLYDFSFWDQTIAAWHAQGLPANYDLSNIARYCGLDASLAGGGLPLDWYSGMVRDLYPPFESRILEDDGDVYTMVQDDGVIVRRQRSSVSIPMHVGHTLVDRESWKKHYLPRLNPDDPRRLPDDWDRRVKVWRDPARSHPTWLGGGWSLYGRLRNWMGLENISLVVYDDPAWFEEMVTTMADLAVGLLQKLFATGGQFDGCALWEDMCYRSGPLLSPQHFKRYLVPQYRRITELCHKHGVDVIWVDCDGRIDELAGLWLEAGVNCMFPIEVGTWGGDPYSFRKRFGKQMLLMGGVDKHILARGPRDIEREVQRLAPLVEEGGYIPMPDHRVPPDVPLANYLHYCRVARRIWGKDTNLPPMEAEHLDRRSQPSAVCGDG